MISFYPGPSRVYEKIPQYVQDAYTQNVLGINHRSEEFVRISERTISLLKEKLNIPESYTVFYTCSATECWEIIAQSLIEKKSLHVYNGAFGQKWEVYTQKLHRKTKSFAFGTNEELRPAALPVDTDTEMICLTQCETSNGTQVSPKLIAKIKKLHPDKLIAVDATSSMGGIDLQFQHADVWFASVQKCFGLPAGLAVMVCSPEAIERANAIGENNRYNSLCFMIDKIRHAQTTYTPNILGIYLLMRSLEDSPSIGKTEQKLIKRYEKWMDFLKGFKDFEPLVTKKSVRAHTVIPLKASPQVVEDIKAKAKEAGFLLGNGYGLWHTESFRIANFPALQKEEIKELMKFMKKNFK